MVTTARCSGPWGMSTCPAQVIYIWVYITYFDSHFWKVEKCYIPLLRQQCYVAPHGRGVQNNCSYTMPVAPYGKPVSLSNVHKLMTIKLLLRDRTTGASRVWDMCSLFITEAFYGESGHGSWYGAKVKPLTTVFSSLSCVFTMAILVRVTRTMR